MDRDEVSERTSITLPASLANRLTYEARRTGRSASAVVRDALTSYFTDATPASLPSFVAIARSGRTDTAEQAEEIIGEIVDERFPRASHRRGGPRDH